MRPKSETKILFFMFLYHGKLGIRTKLLDWRVLQNLSTNCSSRCDVKYKKNLYPLIYFMRTKVFFHLAHLNLSQIIQTYLKISTFKCINIHL